MKTCNKCNTEKELTEFYFRKDLNKHRPSCKECFSTQVAHNKYNITQETLDKLYVEADNKCQICGDTQCAGVDHKSSKYRPLVIDHNHETGKVRGILCNWCNSALGHFKDDPARLYKAIEYLKSTSA